MREGLPVIIVGFLEEAFLLGDVAEERQRVAHTRVILRAFEVPQTAKSKVVGVSQIAGLEIGSSQDATNVRTPIEILQPVESLKAR